MVPNERILRLPSLPLHVQSADECVADASAGVTPPPVWGGVEYTCNRVGDNYFDQTDLSGHARRSSDFEAIASLGIRTLRFGLLWERFERDRSWDWTDNALRDMRQQGIEPIAGLLHHGSGPPWTNLLAPEFPEQLATFAGAVAQRYPDIAAYTPVNEPNTTARFSGRYGLWYPHHRSAESFARALVHQVKGTVLSMEAIRRVRSDARLIQTDDAGGVSATQELQGVGGLLRERQWLTFDLLCGRVDRQHVMFEYLLHNGVSDAEILWFQDHPCPPDVIGLNYYVTSDRFLDHRLDRYPRELQSIEGAFIDVEAVRVHGAGAVDFARPMLEAWRRYRRPVALTEVHLGGPPAEQVRWLAAAHSAVQRAQQQGVQVAALTVWALLGSYFWNELVTRDNGHYEPGAFDVSSGTPVKTLLGQVVQQMASGNAPQSAALGCEGWWQSPERACYPWGEISSVEYAA